MNLPNLISLARLLSVPLLVWALLAGELKLAFWIFIAAGVSDAVDGYVAKRLHVTSELGGYLDPLADKALLVSVYVTLGYQGYLPTWLVILVVFRDLMIIGGALLFQTLTHSLKMQPLLISKINTLAQIVLAAVVLGMAAFVLAGSAAAGSDLYWALVYLVAVTTLLSGAGYLVRWGRKAGNMEDAR